MTRLSNENITKEYVHMKENVVIVEDEERLEEQEIFEFGLSMLKTSIIGIVIALIICIIMDELLYGFLIVLFLLPLRQNAGGFHLNSKYLCLIVSFVIYYYLLLVVKYLSPGAVEMAVICFVSVLLILINAPVDNKNNVLDNDEKIQYRKRTISIVLVEMLAFAVAAYLHMYNICSIISYDFLVCALLVVFGIIKNKLKSEDDNEILDRDM